jgi:hypothetical protein
LNRTLPLPMTSIGDPLSVWFDDDLSRPGVGQAIAQAEADLRPAAIRSSSPS